MAFLPPLCFSWNDKPHEQITQAAIQSLPLAFQEKLGLEQERSVHIYCHYPDYYGDPNGEVQKRAALRIYCEKPDGKSIHNVTWKRQADLESLEYLLRGVAQNLRAGKVTEAAQYAGVLAHFLEDSTCPGHAFIPFDGPLNFIKDLLPPPPGKEHIVLHPALEATLPEFDLGSRAPQIAGGVIPDAASNLLDRCYAIIKDNRAHLLEMVQALYSGDDATLNRFRLKAGKAGAELLADAYYTAFVFSGQTSAACRQDLTPSARWHTKLLATEDFGDKGPCQFQIHVLEAGVTGNACRRLTFRTNKCATQSFLDKSEHSPCERRRDEI